MGAGNMRHEDHNVGYQNRLESEKEKIAGL